jgi:hypothetical protein
MFSNLFTYLRTRAQIPEPRKIRRYQLVIEDNHHFQDESGRREGQIFTDVESALNSCRTMVNWYLEREYRPGMTAAKLYSQYTSFGDDPSIQVLYGTDERAKFSAWNYAKQRCDELCHAPAVG